MKVLGSAAGRRRGFLQGGETARPGSNIVENVRFGLLGALPRTLATYVPSRPSFLDRPGMVLGGENEGWQPTGPTYWTKTYCMTCLLYTSDAADE